MRKLGILIGLMVITILSGAISAGLLNEPLSGLLIQQTTNPDASAFNATPVQAFQLIVWIGFVLVNLIGAGLTLAFFFWFMNRGIANSRHTPVSVDATPPTPAELTTVKGSSLPARAD